MKRKKWRREDKENKEKCEEVLEKKKEGGVWKGFLGWWRRLI